MLGQTLLSETAGRESKTTCWIDCMLSDTFFYHTSSLRRSWCTLFLYPWFFCVMMTSGLSGPSSLILSLSCRFLLSNKFLCSDLTEFSFSTSAILKMNKTILFSLPGSVSQSVSHSCVYTVLHVVLVVCWLCNANKAF